IHSQILLALPLQPSRSLQLGHLLLGLLLLLNLALDAVLDVASREPLVSLASLAKYLSAEIAEQEAGKRLLEFRKELALILSGALGLHDDIGLRSLGATGDDNCWWGRAEWRPESLISLGARK